MPNMVRIELKLLYLPKFQAIFQDVMAGISLYIISENAVCSRLCHAVDVCQKSDKLFACK